MDSLKELSVAVSLIDPSNIKNIKFHPRLSKSFKRSWSQKDVKDLYAV